MSLVELASKGPGTLFSTAGALVPGATAHVYATGTTTPIPVWTDSTGSTPLAQPLTTSSLGQCPGWASGSQKVDYVYSYLVAGVMVTQGPLTADLLDAVTVVSAGSLAPGTGATGDLFIVRSDGTLVRFTPPDVYASAWGVATAATAAVNTAAIKSAIAQAVANSGGNGGTVSVQGGTFALTQDGNNAWCVDIPSGVKIKCNGRGVGVAGDQGATQFTTAYNGVIFRVNTLVYDWGLEDCAVLCTGKGGSQVGLWVDGQSGLCRRVAISDAGLYGLQCSAAGLSGCENNHFDDLHCLGDGSATGTTYGVALFGSATNTFTNLLARVCSVGGVYADSLQSNVFVGGDIEGNNQSNAVGGGGIVIQQGAINTIGVHFEDNNPGGNGKHYVLNGGYVVTSRGMEVGGSAVLVARNGGQIYFGDGRLSEGFSAYRNAASALASGAVIPYDTVEFDVTSALDIVTNVGRYQPKFNGYYRVSANIYISDVLSATQYIQIAVLRNGTAIKQSPMVNGDGVRSDLGTEVTALVYLNGTTNYLEIQVLTNFGTVHLYVGNPAFNTFSAELTGATES